MIKTILLANKFFFLNGGSERVFFQERDFLIDRGFRVIDFSMEDSRNFESPWSSFFVSNIDYHGSKGIFTKINQGAKFIYSPEAVGKIEKIIQKVRPELAHLHNIYHQLTPSIIHVLKKHRIKVVLTLHDGKLICPAYLMLNRGKICTECTGKYFWRPLTTRCQGSFSQGLMLMLEAYWHKWKGSYGMVDLFIAPSQFIADLIGKRIPKDKILLLRNGIDIEQFGPTYPDEGYALYFGRLSREKGIETLLKAYKAVGDNLSLKIVGTGPMEDELHRDYPDVEFLGYQEGEELNDIVAKSAFVVVPSECYENCPMVVLEGMAMGKPIIGSKIGGIPEQIDDGKTGLLYEMGNTRELSEKMKSLWENPNRRQEMGMAARKKLEAEYSLKNHCRGLLRIYEELLVG